MAIRAAPKDESLFSNLSAAYAQLGRYDDALANAKRAITLRPNWGKAYSRAGLAALKGGDEEAAYWFYCNGLTKEPSNVELLNGRNATLQASILLPSCNCSCCCSRRPWLFPARPATVLRGSPPER